MSTKITVKQGEAKTVTLTVTDESGAAVDLSGATLTLGVKKAKSYTAYAISKADADFGKAQAANGIVTVSLEEDETNLTPGGYCGELKAVWTGPPETIEKSIDFYLHIEQAVIPVAT